VLPVIGLGHLPSILDMTFSDLGADPREWCGTFEPVPMEVWGDIQVYDGGDWITPKGPKVYHDPVSGSAVWV
jgi:hypothetical protein